MNTSAGLMALTCALLASTGIAAARPAEMVLRNAMIFSGEDSRPWAEALAVTDGKIVAIGSDKEVRRSIGPNTKTVDGGGRLVIPGIIDSHVHVPYAGRDLANYNCNFSQYSTFEEVISAVADCAAKRQPGEWIIGTFWNSKLYSRLSQQDALAALDAVSPKNPVILRNDTIHDRWANSLALKAAGITKATQSPPRGIIGHDPKTGELNGLLIEGPATALVENVSPIGRAVDSKTQLDRLGDGTAALTAMGVTGWVDAKISQDDAAAYKALDDQNRLHARVGLSMLIDPNVPVDLPGLFKDAKKYETPHISTRFAKIFLDGVMVSRTAMFLDPYLPDEAHGSDFHGPVKVEQALLNRVVTDLDRLGISVKLHAAGDGSVHEALDAIAAARIANGANGPWHTMAHGGYVTSDDIGRYTTLRVAPDASPTVWYPGPILEGTIATIGEDRARKYWPIRTMLARGNLVAGGTDWKTLPDEFSDLWSGIEGMVTRRNPTGKVDGVLDANEAIDLATTIKLFTINGAKLLKIDKVTGSLAVGKSADFVIMDRDIFKIDPSCISQARPIATYFEGRAVFKAKPEAAAKCS